ncbi:MAG: EamA family transporter [Rhizobiales bacterium]|nr:EamA family transporter [Hyphomicrobiales bacterium]
MSEQADAAAEAARLRDNLRGGAVAAAAMVVLALNEAIIKLAAETLPIGELVALRSLFAFVLLAPVVAIFCRSAIAKLVRGDVLGWPLGLRVAGEAGGAIAYIGALAVLPLADVASISQVLPLVLMGAAALLLGERVGWRRWLAAGAGFFGVLLIIRPLAPTFEPASLLVLVAIAFFTMRDLATRRLPLALPTLVVSVVTIVFVGLVGAVFGVGEAWVMPEGREWLLLVASALAQIVFYFLIIYACRTGEISLVAVIRYSKVAWAVLLGWLVFGTLPDATGLAGMAIVVGAGLFALARERQRGHVAGPVAEAGGAGGTVPPGGSVGGAQ